MKPLKAPPGNSAGAVAKGVPALSLVAGFTAFFSAASCCVLPMMLASVGIGASGLAAFVPFRWPLTLLALVAVGAAWGVWVWQARTRGARRSNLIMLVAATALTLLSTCWSLIEGPLMRALA